MGRGSRRIEPKHPIGIGGGRGGDDTTDRSSGTHFWRRVVVPTGRVSSFMKAIGSDNLLKVVRALRSVAALSEQEASALSDWIKRKARLRKFSRPRRPRIDDPYVNRDHQGKFQRPLFDELSNAIVRNHPEDVAKHIDAKLTNDWLIEVANWIDRFFGDRPKGRPKKEPMDATIEAASLTVRSKELTAKQAAERLGKSTNDPDRLSKGEREKYTSNSQRSIERARSRFPKPTK